MELVDNIVKVPAENYYDPTIWQKEIDLIFKRIPLVIMFDEFCLKFFTTLLYKTFKLLSLI